MFFVGRQCKINRQTIKRKKLAEQSELYRQVRPLWKRGVQAGIGDFAGAACHVVVAEVAGAHRAVIAGTVIAADNFPECLAAQAR